MNKRIRYYPLALNLKGRFVVVIGGGKVAERKVKGLLECGSKVKVVSPELTVYLRKLSIEKKIIWLCRKARKNDLNSTVIVIAATNDALLNKAISHWSKQAGALINVVDNPGLSDFISPAILRKGRALLAVYTDGRDPVLSRDLKNFLKENWDEFVSYRRKL